MSKNYVQSNDAAYGLQLRNFYQRLDVHSSLLGFTTADVDEAKADSQLWDYCLNSDTTIEKFARDYKQTKNLLRFGKGNQTITAMPAVPVLAAPPAMVPENIQFRFIQKAGQAKASINYTTAIGLDLGIESTQQTFDPTQGKPNLSAYLDAGHPELEYTRGKYNGVAIYKDSGSGYAFLGSAFRSHYRDRASLPAAGSSEVWKYKAIYLWHDEETGIWSDEISVAVKG